MLTQSPIINYFRKRKTLCEDEIIFLNQVFEQKLYQQDEIVLKKGEICNYRFIIKESVKF